MTSSCPDILSWRSDRRRETQDASEVGSRPVASLTSATGFIVLADVNRSRLFSSLSFNSLLSLSTRAAKHSVARWIGTHCMQPRREGRGAYHSRFFRMDPATWGRARPPRGG